MTVKNDSGTAAAQLNGTDLAAPVRFNVGQHLLSDPPPGLFPESSASQDCSIEDRSKLNPLAA
jgi:hypothetical protein